jgi:hypothetical protein
VTNRKKGEHPVRTPSPLRALLLVARESHLTPSQSEYTKHHHK